MLGDVVTVVADMPIESGILKAMLVMTAVVSGVAILVALAVKRWLDLEKRIRERFSEKVAQVKDYRPQIHRDLDISVLLADIKHNLSADRTSVYQYHNGEKSINNNPFLKFSCTHENLRQTAESVQTKMLELPSSIFNEWNSIIFDGEVVSCPQISSLASKGDMRTAYEILKANRVTSIYLFPLIDPLGRTFGFGTIEYCCDKVELSESWLAWAQEKFSAAGFLVSASVVVEEVASGIKQS